MLKTSELIVFSGELIVKTMERLFGSGLLSDASHIEPAVMIAKSKRSVITQPFGRAHSRDEITNFDCFEGERSRGTETSYVKTVLN